MKMKYEPARFCVAPMLGYTDRACRLLYRLLSQHSLFYSEMVPAQALIKGNAIRYSCLPEEGAVSMQLADSDAKRLAEAASIAEALGYAEINLNVGCPSSRVQQGGFGAVLMLQSEKVAEMVSEIRAKTNLPISVKCRLGVDHHDSDAFLFQFIDTIAEAGCSHFVIHARKAWLKGLNPSKNRTIPELNYDRVFQLKKRSPHLKIVINGGLTEFEKIRICLEQVDGVMVGRAVYAKPWLLTEVDSLIFSSSNAPCVKTRSDFLHQVFEQWHVLLESDPSIKPKYFLRHLMGLYHGESGSSAWKQLLLQGYLSTSINAFEQSIKNFSMKK